MRISASSRRRCRMISCPAACGIRCVKPSSATVSPSRTRAEIASASETISATALTLRGCRRCLRALELGRVLEVDDLVVAEELDQAVLADQEAERLVAGV